MTAERPMIELRGPHAAPFAIFSGCDTHAECPEACRFRPYRYFLDWSTAPSDGALFERGGQGAALGVFANPSTATAEAKDPTVSKWIKYCRAWGFTRAWVVNVRAWRETNPKLVPPDPQAVGPLTDEIIAQAAQKAALVVCGWGKLGGVRGPEVLTLLRGVGVKPHALALNRDGTPRHPLYLRDDLKPEILL